MRMSTWPSAPAAAVIKVSGAPGAMRSEPRCGGSPSSASTSAMSSAPHGRSRSWGTWWWANTSTPAARSRRAIAKPIPARRLTPVISALLTFTSSHALHTSCPISRAYRDGEMTESLFARGPVEIAPGAVHVPAHLPVERQRELVQACRGWARRMRHTKLPNGGVMSVQTVCLGWHWLPYRYSRTVDDVDGAPVAPFPDWLRELGREALAAAYGDAGTYAPDAALINFYDDQARMGMHQDKEERADAPVVSLSIGDTCVFRFGNAETRGKPYTDVELRSGDLFVFGGPSRWAYHGVPKVLPGTADPATGLTTGRLNLTLRETGL